MSFGAHLIPAAQRTARSDGEDTRVRLLHAALQLFSERGFAQTSVRAIAEAAGTNVAAIAYHFGDKARLYTATFYEPFGSGSDLIPVFADPALTLHQALAAYFDGTLLIEDFQTPDAAAWESEAASIGAAQPLSRLQWLGGLVSGHGMLLPGLDADGKYRLLKWPQTEREYPKHFRIATAMMKGPATVDEVAAASGVSREEVADFVNANLATGYAEQVLPAPPEPEAPAPKPAGGLFGRIRGR